MPDDYSDLLRRIRKLEAQISKTSTADKAKPIAARAETAVALNCPNAAATIIQYDTVTFDPLELITPGAAWKFTAPIPGYYHIQAAASIQSTTTWALGEPADFRLFKNGSSICLLDRDDEMNSAAMAQIKALSGSDVISLAAGDFIDIRMVQQSGGALTLHPFATVNYISIFKIN